MLVRWAFRDDLTGLLNRRGFRLLAKNRLQSARRGGREVLLFFADLDGFKRINDKFGHAAGDQALVRVASALKRTFRRTDIVARLGGDEFVALVTEDPGCSAASLYRRLRERVAGAAEAEEESRYQLSISVGLACWDPKTVPSLSRMMAVADHQLNQAKHGRPTPPARTPTRRLAV